MRRTLRLAAPLALAATALLALPASPAGGAVPVAPPPRAPAGAPVDEIPRLQAALDGAAAQATRLAVELEGAAARAGDLRVQLARLAEEQDAARNRVDTRARQAYLAAGAGAPSPLAGLVAALAAPDLHALAEAELARRGSAAAVRAALQLAGAVDEHSAAAQALQEQAAAHRAGLQAQGEQALAAQEAARHLLAQAESKVAAALAEEQRVRAAQAADVLRAQAAESASARAAELTSAPAAELTSARAAELAAAQAALSATRSSLDSASAAVTQALMPAPTRRGQSAAAREAPVLALVEAAGSGLPAGYAPTGTALRGAASWYGPGFVGSPTASGTPYDPERLTCAHKTLPLGAVVRVSRGDRAISCLVNDRGPYAADRIIDLSRAGSRALGFDGVTAVVVEVLAPVR